MPKLSTEAVQVAQREAEPADLGDEPIPEGVYRLRLVGVEERTLAESREPKLIGAQMWIWTFEIVEGEFARRRFSTNRIVPLNNGYRHAPRMFRALLDAFEALGATPDTDTNDLVGRTCRGFIELADDWRTDAKPGEQANRLEDLMPDGPTDAKGEGDEYEF